MDLANHQLIAAAGGINIQMPKADNLSYIVQGERQPRGHAPTD